MNLSGIFCYLGESILIKTTKISTYELNQLYFTTKIKLKDVYNSNDFSYLSITLQNFYDMVNIKDTFSIKKKLSLIKMEKCIILEENSLKKIFSKKLKNFAYWESIQWTFEKEFYSNFYILFNILSLFLFVSPGNYYIDNYLSSSLKAEKTETWILLLIADILFLLDSFKELGWNLKSILSLRARKTNKDIFFSVSSLFNQVFHTFFWKFLNYILMTNSIRNGLLISSLSIIVNFKQRRK